MVLAKSERLTQKALINSLGRWLRQMGAHQFARLSNGDSGDKGKNDTRRQIDELKNTQQQ